MKRLVLACVFVLTGLLLAQARPEDGNRRWALYGGVGSSLQTISHNDYPGSVKQPGVGWNIHAEYYLPDVPFSVKVGYSREELALWHGEISTKLNQLNLGGRWHMLPSHYVVQPFAGVDAFFHLGSLNEQGSSESWVYRGNEWVKNYETSYSIRVPRFSVAPVIGVDMYLFSCVALQLGYGYAIGVDSHFDVYARNCLANKDYVTRAKGNRHVLSIGLKLNFPFSFSDSDTNNLIDWILRL